MSIGTRTTQERKRLGFDSQQAAAAAFKIKQQTLNAIERDKSMPGGETLQAFAQFGADVHFILTGDLRRPAIDWKAITALVEFRIAARSETLATADDVVEIVRGAMSLWQDINARDARVPLSAEQEAAEANVRG